VRSVRPPAGIDLTDWARDDRFRVSAELSVTRQLRRAAYAITSPSRSVVE
jgi:hypothetical protein